MKATELKKGESYGTVWGIEMTFVGTEVLDVYYEELDEHVSSTRYLFESEGRRTSHGISSLSEDEVERLVSNNTLKISTERLDQIMKGCIARDDQIAEAHRMTLKVIDKIENMHWDCDGEVYDSLLKIADVLGR